MIPQEPPLCDSQPPFQTPMELSDLPIEDMSEVQQSCKEVTINKLQLDRPAQTSTFEIPDVPNIVDLEQGTIHSLNWKAGETLCTMTTLYNHQNYGKKANPSILEIKTQGSMEIELQCPTDRFGAWFLHCKIWQPVGPCDVNPRRALVHSGEVLIYEKLGTKYYFEGMQNHHHNNLASITLSAIGIL